MRLLEGIELAPVTRMTWNSLAAREIWEERIRRVQALYWRLERETVMRGVRDCNVWYLTPENYARDLQEIVEQGLQFIPIRNVQRYEGFSHRHVELPEGSPGAMTYGVVCRDRKAGLAFKEAHLARPIEHEAIGALLGYPTCCTEFFQREWVDNHYIDPIWQQALGTPGAELLDDGHTIHVKGDPRCNVILRFFGIRLSPLLPHSFSCPDCAAFVDQWVQIGMEIDPEGMADMLTLLEMPILWDAYKGLGIIHTPIFRGHVNTVACYPRYQVRYEAADPKHFDYGTFRGASKGLGWPYDQFSPNAILARMREEA